MAWVPLCAETDVPSGDMKHFDVEDYELALYHVGDRFYVTSAICTHERADLTLGELEERVVTCPLHGARFDVTSGKVLSPPAFKPLKIYRVQVQDGQVLVDLP